MDVVSSLREKKVVISSFLEGFFAAKRADWRGINCWGGDVLDRLEPYVLKGKMLRGALVLWTAEMLGVPEDRALPAAAAMELLQAALLIHDDIMDEDVLRRGSPTVHKQYESQGLAQGVLRADHFGVSMGVCAGDLAFFLAYEVLAECDDVSLIQLFSELAAIVGLGQMQDVFWGQHPAVPADGDILAMYEHKTATYTFCLPFLLAARLAGKESLAAPLDALGRLLGKLFQLKDDELGLYGGVSLGKTVGLDVLLGKKTVYYSLLLSLISDEEAKRLRSLQSSLSSDDALAFVRGLLEKYGVASMVARDVEVLVVAANALIGNLPVDDCWRSFLRSLVVFNQERLA